MTAEQIYELARKRQPFPDNAPLSEQLLYSTARNIYKAFSDGIITEAQAKQEKANSIQAFAAHSRAEQSAADIFRRMAAISELLLEAEKSGCEYCKRIARIFDGRDNVEA